MQKNATKKQIEFGCELGVNLENCTMFEASRLIGLFINKKGGFLEATSFLGYDNKRFQEEERKKMKDIKWEE